MADVRSDSRICIQDKSGTIKTIIFEEDFEQLGYKAAGWTVVQTDWTKERVVKPPIDVTKEMGLQALGNK